MQKPLLFVLLFILLAKLSFAQADTIYHYYGKNGKEVSRDSAYSYMKLYRTNDLWFGEGFYIKGNVPQSVGNYTDKDGKTPVGSFKNYTEKGELYNTIEYDKGSAVTKTFYYKSGNKKSFISYNDKGIAQQKGWDEAGKEIRNFVVEREAYFKGGSERWKKFLEKNINANVAADVNAPVGNYEVKVQFVISKDGYVSNVKAISVPAACKPCGAEAVNVISSSPEWEPAIQNNEPVLYQALQYVTFQVAEEMKKARK